MVSKKELNMTIRSIPWMTDDSVRFIYNFIDNYKKGEKILPSILEFGMGASTFFFAYRSSVLVSFEHNIEWYTKVTEMLKLQDIKHNYSYFEKRPYSNKIKEKVGLKKFDIISIDGRDRISCLEEILNQSLLAKDGIIVIDNTERVIGGKYEKMYSLLDIDFNMVHFEQLGADREGWVAPHRWITSIAYKKIHKQYTTLGNKF